MKKRELKNKDLIIAISMSLIIASIAWKLLGYVPEVLEVVYKFYGLIVSFLYAFVIAYVLNPLVSAFEKYFKMKRGLAIVATYIICFGAIVVLAFVAIPSLYQSVIDISAAIPGYIQEAQSFFYRMMEEQNIKDLINATGTSSNINEMISNYGNLAIKILEGTVSKAFTVTTSVMNIVLGFIISIYVLSDKDRFLREGKRFSVITIGKKNTEKISGFIMTFHYMIGTYIGIKALDSAIIGGLAFILLNIFGSEYALFLSVIVGVTNMIPYFGPLVGEVIGFLFNVFVSPTKAVIIFLVLFGLQMFDGWYLDPKLVGDKVGVRPFYILLGIVIGGGFFGPIGMLIASPAVATLKIYYDKYIERREAKIAETELESEKDELVELDKNNL